MKISELLLAALISAVFAVAFGFIAVRALKKLKFSQTISGYVVEHAKKNGTPTVGGIIFVVPALAVYLIFRRGSFVYSFAAASIFFAYAVVGLIDDLIKIKFKRNEGLTPIQKIAFETAVAIFSSVFVYRMGLTEQFVPFTRIKIPFYGWFIPVSVLIFLAASNCVNLTDGLDGLAGTDCAVFLVFSAALIIAQSALLPADATALEEYSNLALLCVAAAAALGGFLLYNTSKASVFMGDTGSLALGGLIASVMIFSGNAFYIPVLGITFVATGVSVILQVAHFKRTGRRIFLMAPLHHHFQHKGYSESKIVYAYKLVTVAAGIVSLLIYIGD